MSKRHEKRDLARKAAGLLPWGTVNAERAKKTPLAREASAREATSRPKGARTAPSAPDPAPTPQTHGVRQCRWIDDEDYIARIRAGGVPWTCEAEALLGKPYCEEHDRRAHVSPGPKKRKLRLTPMPGRLTSIAAAPLE